MPLPSQTVKSFLRQCYQLISASNPNVPLQGTDESDGLILMNQLLNSYSGTGLMLTIPKEVTFNIFPPTAPYLVTFGSPNYTPTPDVAQGRLANLQSAWLVLDGVSYPLINESRNEFLYAYKFSPLQGLPRYIIVYPQTNLTTIQLYPAPSQFFEVHVYGKFELPDFGINDDMSGLPDYYRRFFRFAVAKELSFMKGRSTAWTPNLEAEYMNLKKDMESTSTFNLDLQVDRDSKLNGKWRVEAGI